MKHYYTAINMNILIIFIIILRTVSSSKSSAQVIDQMDISETLVDESNKAADILVNEWRQNRLQSENDVNQYLQRVASNTTKKLENLIEKSLNSSSNLAPSKEPDDSDEKYFLDIDVLKKVIYSYQKKLVLQKARHIVNGTVFNGTISFSDDVNLEELLKGVTKPLNESVEYNTTRSSIVPRSGIWGRRRCRRVLLCGIKRMPALAIRNAFIELLNCKDCYSDNRRRPLRINDNVNIYSFDDVGSDGKAQQPLSNDGLFSTDDSNNLMNNRQESENKNDIHTFLPNKFLHKPNKVEDAKKKPSIGGHEDITYDEDISSDIVLSNEYDDEFPDTWGGLQNNPHDRPMKHYKIDTITYDDEKRNDNRKNNDYKFNHGILSDFEFSNEYNPDSVEFNWDALKDHRPNHNTKYPHWGKPKVNSDWIHSNRRSGFNQDENHSQQHVFDLSHEFDIYSTEFHDLHPRRINVRKKVLYHSRPRVYRKSRPVWYDDNSSGIDISNEYSDNSRYVYVTNGKRYKPRRVKGITNPGRNTRHRIFVNKSTKNAGANVKKQIITHETTVNSNVQQSNHNSQNFGQVSRTNRENRNYNMGKGSGRQINGQ